MIIDKYLMIKVQSVVGAIWLEYRMGGVKEVQLATYKEFVMIKVNHPVVAI